ncbi:MAG: hypothetical protein ACD_28C00072G0002 [uncultured bacterium]|nr:MAG: hypothetical protein ACD_28C00072G0002 [uncultured bacterium]KKT74132.1 MAG: hypothetical protein UW70_C0065G0002 [Candidatus Peregrinibacteria bacterium GW2011_GWA2_44_7]
MSADFKALNSLLDQLIGLGENPIELDFWRDFFHTLNENEKKALISSFTREVKDLETLSRKKNPVKLDRGKAL